MAGKYRVDGGEGSGDPGAESKNPGGIMEVGILTVQTGVLRSSPVAGIGLMALRVSTRSPSSTKHAHPCGCSLVSRRTDPIIETFPPTSGGVSFKYSHAAEER